MDVPLQRHCARYIYVVPDGLRELLSDISREVIREQPEDVYTFIADYLDALLITRENARVAAKFVEYTGEVAESIVELLNTTGMPREEIDKAAETIQRSFRGWTGRKGIIKESEEAVITKIIEDAGISEDYANAAATVIQHAFASYKTRIERRNELLSGIIDWRVAARSAIKLYRKTGVSTEEAKRAANLIKAAYQGYYTRRGLKLLQPARSIEEEEEMTSSESSDLDVYKKCKEVRIDYSSIAPRVDFGDSHIIDYIPFLGEGDIFVGTDHIDDPWEFIRKLLDETVNKAATFAENVKGNEYFHTYSGWRDSQTSATRRRPFVGQAELQAELKTAKEELQELRLSRLGFDE